MPRIVKQYEVAEKQGWRSRGMPVVDPKEIARELEGEIQKQLADWSPDWRREVGYEDEKYFTYKLFDGRAETAPSYGVRRTDTRSSSKAATASPVSDNAARHRLADRRATRAQGR